MQQVNTTDDSELDILQFDLLSTSDGLCECRIIGKLHWCAIRSNPVLGMTELSGPGEASGFELGTWDLDISGYSHINIESGAGFSLMDLEGYTTNNSIRHCRLCEDSSKR